MRFSRYKSRLIEAVEDLEVPEELSDADKEKQKSEKEKVAARVIDPLMRSLAQSNNKLTAAFEKFFDDENETLVKKYEGKLEGFEGFMKEIPQISNEYSQESSKTIDQIVKANQAEGENKILINFLQLASLKFIQLAVNYATEETKDTDYRKAKDIFEKYYIGKLKSRLPEQITSQLN